MPQDIINLSPIELNDAMSRGEVILIDVREVNEFAVEHIKGAINMPLSQLSGLELPKDGGKTLVLQCAGGVRSIKAALLCREAGRRIGHHLAGGIGAWKARGFETIS